MDPWPRVELTSAQGSRSKEHQAPREIVVSSLSTFRQTYMHVHSLLLYIDFNDVSDVVWHYQQKQANDRAGSSFKSRNRSSATSPRCYSVCYNLCAFVLSIMQYSVYIQLNFAQYRRAGRFGYQMMPLGRIQISGFSDADTYCDVAN